MVQEVVTEKVPHVTWVCVPKTVTKQIPHKVCEQVAGDLLQEGDPDGPLRRGGIRRGPGRRPDDAGRARPRRPGRPAPSIQGGVPMTPSKQI